MRTPSALFEKLLQPESLAELRTKYFGPNTTRRRAPRGKADALTETLVAAVGANGTDASRACLRRLLEGRMQTDDDKAAALAALRVLVNPPCSENEDMIFELLTSDQWPSPSDKAKLTVGQLRAEAIKLLKPTASIAMRLRVARHLAARGAAPPWRELLEGLVLSDDPANLEAQIVLYQDRLARQDPTIDALEAAFTGCSSPRTGPLAEAAGTSGWACGRSEPLCRLCFGVALGRAVSRPAGNSPRADELVRRRRWRTPLGRHRAE